MRVPIRKPGKYTYLKPDHNFTADKLNELKDKLERLKISQPAAIKEVRRLAELGDFSENAAYQIAKGRLRGINDQIFELQEKIKKAQIIKPKNTDCVQLGCKVTIQLNNQQKTFLILGSAEADPSKGIISHNSPIGAALMGKKPSDIIKINLSGKEIEYKIIKIE
ncbi:MAG: GreA/GreB family elongation factor [Cyanobacteria bacterium]|nr:GreA/GreB family elongation factor [Cyanobacteriota bacterium]MCL5795226.1 GreA/GreB family elongation factor [Patescibacteria group bacterium]